MPAAHSRGPVRRYAGAAWCSVGNASRCHDVHHAQNTLRIAPGAFVFCLGLLSCPRLLGRLLAPFPAFSEVFFRDGLGDRFGNSVLAPADMKPVPAVWGFPLLLLWMVGG